MVQRKQRIVLKDFTFKVGELIVEQEVSEDDISMPETALKAIGQVIATPQQLLGLESNGTEGAKVVEPQVAPTLPVSAPRVRRRRRPPGNGAERVNGEAGSGAASGAGATQDGAPALILELKEGGYFREPKDAVQVRAKLHERGHTFATEGNVRMALLALTRNKDAGKKLYRRQDRNKKWLYQDTPHDSV